MLKKVFNSRDVVASWNGWSSVMVKNKFSIKKAYFVLSGNFSKVAWKHIVCNNLASPKIKFILWLAALNRLLIVDWLLNWVNKIYLICRLCSRYIKSHDHLIATAISISSYLEMSWGS